MQLTFFGIKNLSRMSNTLKMLEGTVNIISVINISYASFPGSYFTCKSLIMEIGRTLALLKAMHNANVCLRIWAFCRHILQRGSLAHPRELRKQTGRVARGHRARTT
jgi:hypothetical protein